MVWLDPGENSIQRLVRGFHFFVAGRRFNKCLKEKDYGGGI
jgi:hypothetical protein